jgi:hypothetical protein
VFMPINRPVGAPPHGATHDYWQQQIGNAWLADRQLEQAIFQADRNRELMQHWWGRFGHTPDPFHGGAGKISLSWGDLYGGGYFPGFKPASPSQLSMLKAPVDSQGEPIDDPPTGSGFLAEQLRAIMRPFQPPEDPTEPQTIYPSAASTQYSPPGFYAIPGYGYFDYQQ